MNQPIREVIDMELHFNHMNIQDGHVPPSESVEGRCFSMMGRMLIHTEFLQALSALSPLVPCGCNIVPTKPEDTYFLVLVLFRTPRSHAEGWPLSLDWWSQPQCCICPVSEIAVCMSCQLFQLPLFISFLCHLRFLSLYGRWLMVGSLCLCF
jgi:hypothetical protein